MATKKRAAKGKAKAKPKKKAAPKAAKKPAKKAAPKAAKKPAKKAAPKKAAPKKAAPKKAAPKKGAGRGAKAMAKVGAKGRQPRPAKLTETGRLVPRTRVRTMKPELEDVYDEPDTSPGLARDDAGASAAPVRSTTTLVQTVEVPAPPAYVYRAFLDSEQHSKFTGGGANIDPSIGGKFTAWDGYISGTTLELIDGKIVQSWRTSEWPDDYDDSRLEIQLAPSPMGTKLTMVHDSVPTSQAASLEQGWIDHYWEPLRKFFAAVAD